MYNTNTTSCRTPEEEHNRKRNLPDHPPAPKPSVQLPKHITIYYIQQSASSRRAESELFETGQDSFPSWKAQSGNPKIQAFQVAVSNRPARQSSSRLCAEMDSRITFACRPSDGTSPESPEPTDWRYKFPKLPTI